MSVFNVVANVVANINNNQNNNNNNNNNLQINKISTQNTQVPRGTAFYFFNGRAIKALSPPPSSLMAVGT